MTAMQISSQILGALYSMLHSVNMKLCCKDTGDIFDVSEYQRWIEARMNTTFQQILDIGYIGVLLG